MRHNTYTIWLVIAAFQTFLVSGVRAVPGDADGDNYVGMDDLSRIAAWWTSDGCEFYNNCNGADMTGPAGIRDGIVDLYDFGLLAAYWLEEDPLPGDANGDGIVDIGDVMRIADWWTIDICDLFDSCDGADMTGPAGLRDGIVDFYDFALLASHWLEGGAAE